MEFWPSQQKILQYWPFTSFPGKKRSKTYLEEGTTFVFLQHKKVGHANYLIKQQAIIFLAFFLLSKINSCFFSCVDLIGTRGSIPSAINGSVFLPEGTKTYVTIAPCSVKHSLWRNCVKYWQQSNVKIDHNHGGKQSDIMSIAEMNHWNARYI